jgi:hypothetical protein
VAIDLEKMSVERDDNFQFGFTNSQIESKHNGSVPVDSTPGFDWGCYSRQQLAEWYLPSLV